jgi:kumamolisin
MSSHVILGGSSNPEHPAPDETLSITCILKRRSHAPEPAKSFLSHAELSQRHGADSVDIEAVEQFAAAHGLSVFHANSATRSVELSGPKSLLLELFEPGIPEPLADRLIGVVGLNDQPVAHTRHHVFHRSEKSKSYTPPEIAQAYNFPESTGNNQTIALIELGGGYQTTDLDAYWKQLGVSNVRTVTVPVNGSDNHPTGNADGPDGEVALDIEVVGGVVPAAQIVVYFAPNTDQGFYNAISAAIHDSVHKPSVISISWGSPESSWTAQTMDAFNAAFHDAALLGISVCAAAGDNGSSDGADDNANHVDFPASSPWVLACGGTRLTPTTETVWNDGSDGGATGGGVSTHFAKPSYQSALNISGRGVPDVSGNADPETGYVVRVDGSEGVIGGTSAVAPLWAGLIALLNEQLGKNVGWLHPKLYGQLSERQALRDITSGNNGAYQAQTGWDACTGLGSPNGQAILNLLKT